MSKTVDSVISSPKWLNNDFICLHLRNYFNDQRIQIVGFEVWPATAGGKNYSSIMYRVNVQFATQTMVGNTTTTSLSVIAKTPLTDEISLVAISAYDSYKKEIEFYSQITPKINQTLTQFHTTEQLFANSYGVCMTNDALLLEDLAAKSYSTASIQRGFNFDEAKIVLKKIAIFHAINAVLQQGQSDIFANFKYGFMSRHINVLDYFYLTQFDALTEAFSLWPNANYYMAKLHRLRNNLKEKGCQATESDPNQFNTLIHGDLFVNHLHFTHWINNIMLNYKMDRPDYVKSDKASEQSLIENIIFVDFQYSCWTSPAVDLHYFFNTSLQESLRPNRLDDLIDVYHGHLEAYLMRLGYKKSIPNLDQFKKQYHDKHFYGFIVSCLVQPVFLLETANSEMVISENEHSLNAKRTMYASQKVQANLRKLIPMYDEMGLFD